MITNVAIMDWAKTNSM